MVKAKKERCHQFYDFIDGVRSTKEEKDGLEEEERDRL